MTKQFEKLKEGPQTEIVIEDMNFEERSQVRRIGLVSGSSSSIIYYLPGDEKEAAEKFAEVNESTIEHVDFSKNRNKLQSSLDREIYDWVLHTIGERNLQKFEAVVVEERSDGTIWTIEREHYEKASARRYTISDQVAARIQGETLKSIYEMFDDTITESDLRGLDSIEGDVRFVLDAIRSMPEFDCKPVSIDGELAIQKLSQSEPANH